MAKKRDCLVQIYCEDRENIDIEYNDAAIASYLDDDVAEVPGAEVTAALVILTSGAAHAAADLVENGYMGAEETFDLFMSIFRENFTGRIPEIALTYGVDVKPYEGSEKDEEHFS